MLIGILIIIVLGIGAYMLGQQRQRSLELGTVVEPEIKTPAERYPDDKVTVTVTYLDGTVESFLTEQEVTLTGDGSFMFRIGPRCVTISRSGYRKLEEVHSNKDWSTKD